MLHSMSYHFLLTFFFIVSVSHANPLDRKRTSEKCSGIPQEVVLGAGRDIVLKNEGFEEEFIEGCSVGNSLFEYHSNENTNPDAV